MNTLNSLQGKIALVTGASRGAGRGIAEELGKAGAYVYVTGRSVAGSSTHGWPGTIDETVRVIRDAGGQAAAIRCDHTVDEETEHVVETIRKEQGRLDIVVNNVWGGNEYSIDPVPFWDLPLAHWDTMFTAGVRAQIATNHFAVPLLRKSGGGLIVHTTFWDDHKYTGHFYYDLAKHTLTRMAYGLSHELADDLIAVVAVSPGWMRTELVLKAFGVREDNWHESADLQHTETPHYVGRAVTALASDPQIMNKTGGVFRVGDLAEEYGFTDIDGRRVPPFRL